MAVCGARLRGQASVIREGDRSNLGVQRYRVSRAPRPKAIKPAFIINSGIVMPNWKLKSFSIALLAAVATVSACKQDRAESPPARREPNTSRAAAVDSVDVLIHMTGLLMVVPPAKAGDPLNVFLPAVVNHFADLGIGIASGSAEARRLCKNNPAADSGICYVDLERWSLDPLGAGGTTATISDLDKAGVANATRGSSGAKAEIAKLDNRLRAQIVLSGRLGEPCSLADWTFQPPDESEQPLPAANVVRWIVRLPRSAMLVFRLKANPNSTVSVPLTPDEKGAVEIVLAQVTSPEEKQLPPAPTSAPTSFPDKGYSPTHFARYYDLLSRRDGLPGDVPGKRKPKFKARPTQPRACAVRVTTPVVEIVKRDGGIKTFSCLPASGEFGP